MYTILTDSCSDMNHELLSGINDVVILPMSYTIGGVTSDKVMTDEAEIKAFYSRLRAGEMSTTAQVPLSVFIDTFEQYAKAGKPLLCVLFSSALSGTFGAACVARETVLETYPDAVIELVDTLSASAGEGLMVFDALKNREDGMRIEENAAWLRERIQNYVQWFTVDDLHFLKRGGRCSPSSAFFGSMLSIKPILNVNDEGRLIARQKVRGRHQALKALAAKVGELGDGADQTIFISHGDCLEDAVIVKNQLVDAYGCKPEKIVLSYIGPVIAGHAGPGTVALFFHGKERG